MDGAFCVCQFCFLGLPREGATSKGLERRGVTCGGLRSGAFADRELEVIRATTLDMPLSDERRIKTPLHK